MTNQAQSRYWDDPYEECMVRETRTTNGTAIDIEVAIKFYGKEDEWLVNSHHRLYRDVVLSESASIDAETYARGKDREPQVMARLSEGMLARVAAMRAAEKVDGIQHEHGTDTSGDTPG